MIRLKAPEDYQIHKMLMDDYTVLHKVLEDCCLCETVLHKAPGSW